MHPSSLIRIPTISKSLLRRRASALALISVFAGYIPAAAAATDQVQAQAAKTQADLRSIRVTPEIKNGVLNALKVEMHFTGDADGETVIQLPNSRVSRAGSSLDTISDFQVSNATVSGETREERILTHRPGAPITLHYRITQKFNAQFATVVQPTHFSAVGAAIFPDIQGREEFQHKFSWGPLPAGWSVASDLEHKPLHPTARDLYASTLIGGSDVFVGEQKIGAGRFRVAMRSETGLDLENFSNLAGKIARTANDLWEEPGIDYLVTVNTVNDPRGRVYSGLSLTDGYTLYLSPNPDPLPLRQTVAHEYLHNWVSKRLGDLGNTWFREGFADYYGRLVNLRAGAYSLQDFVAMWNDALLRYADSPYRLMPDSEAEAKALDGDGEVQNAEQDRGSIMAALLDYRLRKATKGKMTLTDVLLQVKKDFDRGLGEGKGPDRMVKKAREMAGADLQADIDRHLTRGQELLLPQDLFAGCATVATLVIPRFDAGFPAGQTGKPIQGVDPAGPAYAAGLRDGMIVVRREAGRPGNSRVELAYRVKDGDQERTIRYLPAGRQTVKVQELQLKPALSQSAAARCSKLMSGVRSS